MRRSPRNMPNNPQNSILSPNVSGNQNQTPLTTITGQNSNDLLQSQATVNAHNSTDFFPNSMQNTSNNSANIILTHGQFTELLGSLNARQNTMSTFVNCSARFNGGKSVTKVEDFIATILVFKEAEKVSDEMALISFPLLLEGYASTWWQGVKTEAANFKVAIDLLRKAFSPPKPDWRIFLEINQEKQKIFESTDTFICKKRRLFAQLSERLSEKTMLNIIFSQILLSIREKIPRESVNSFQELLQKAREIEMLIQENKEPKQKITEITNKSAMRCSFCRKKNHTSDVCYKKIEADRKGNLKAKETTLSCYGCGLAGFYRSNCPNCNKKDPISSPEKLDFYAVHTTVVGRDVPTADINISGLKGEAYLDTAARTSVAGYSLFQKLKQKEVEFQQVLAEIILADGVSHEQIVYSTIVNVLIGNRLKRIRFICLPKARANRTLIGIDFLEQAGIVLDLAQRVWHFKDDPNTYFELKTTTPNIEKSIPLTQVNIVEQDNINNFLTRFENSNTTKNSVQSTPKDNNNSPVNDYSPGGINKIFEGSIPDNLQTDVYDWDLFTPPKRVKVDDKLKNDDEHILEINSLDLKLKNFEGTNLLTSQKLILENLLEEFQSVFENTTETVPHVQHFINTGTHAPISCSPYRISPVMREKLKKEIANMLKNEIIKEEESPWAFPVVLIPKKDGGIRVCVDYRRLNAITVTDKYPLPRMDDLLQAAKVSPFMSTIDLKAGYWQIKMSDEDKLKTAFTTPFGIFVFNRMPFGLKNAPATFQRLVDKFRNGLPKIMILAYLDDIIICSKDFESHIKDLRNTFDRIKTFKLQLNREKCHFCRPEVKYLGHVLNVKGLKPDPEKTAAILQRPNPKNIKQLISFLQTCSWYRRFIPNFAEISKPLSDLTKKNIKWKWKDEEQNSFDKLKNCLVSPPILQQMDESKPFYLKTDASNYALGAVLLQGEKENEHPIEYASRLLLAAERNYSTTEREALAVVWAVKKFRGYIEGSEISILTDHQPLKWLFSLKSPTGRLARWALQLQHYNIKFGYTPGRQNVVADTLSRPPCPLEKHKNSSCECCSISIDVPQIGSAEVRKAQLEDVEIKTIITSFEADDENLCRYTSRGYLMIDGVLYRYCSDQDSENGQLVVPKSMRSIILRRFHNDSTAGHYGIKTTISRIVPHYYWQGMRAEIISYVKNCIECQKYKATNLKPAGLFRTVASNQRFEVIAIDLVGPLPRTNKGHQWILVVEDICSRWVELFALTEAKAENCSIIILNEIVLRYGVPRIIHTDNGCQFISAVMQKLTFCLGINQTFTPVYHPQANPVERKNRDLKTQLAICVGKEHTTWHLNLPMIRFAMNTSKCVSTGYSAAYLTFGRELRSPLEAHHDLRSIIVSENFIPQITPHLIRLADTLKIAKETVEKTQDRNQVYVNAKRRPQIDFNIGDRVLVATHVLSNSSKNITSKFTPRRDGPYKIISKKGPCYTIAKEESPEIPIATYHATDLTPYENSSDKPIYPLRRRGRPASNTSTTAITQNQSSINVNDSQPSPNSTECSTAENNGLIPTQNEDISCRKLRHKKPKKYF